VTTRLDLGLGCRLGLDIDGTITLDPALFAEVATACKAARGEVHVVTSRSEASRQQTLAELQGYDIPFDALYFIGEVSVASERCPHKELDWFQRYLWQKADYALRHQLTHFVDDDPKVLSLFAAFAPKVVVTPAERRVEIADPLYELAVQVVLERKQASIGLVQRTLRLGYSRTVRLMEAMAEAGIVSQGLGLDGFREVQPRYQRRGEHLGS